MTDTHTPESELVARLRESDDILIALRRFGPRFEKLCQRPEIIECARWKCQVANACQFSERDDVV